VGAGLRRLSSRTPDRAGSGIIHGVMWPWEQFNWGVFWAVAAVLLIWGLFHWVGQVFDRVLKALDIKLDKK
jgi:hypothetical protein